MGRIRAEGTDSTFSFATAYATEENPTVDFDAVRADDDPAPGYSRSSLRSACCAAGSGRASTQRSIWWRK